MTTAAHAMTLPSFAATDEMDLHSDDGLDFGDGDIELDLEPTPALAPTNSARHEREDVQIEDAEIDTGLDTEAVTASQDDFMEDHDEDFDDAHDSRKGGASLMPAGLNTSSDEKLAFDEDLIDYSSDDDEQSSSQKHAPLVQDTKESPVPEDEDASPQSDYVQAKALEQIVSRDSSDQSYDDHDEHDQAEDNVVPGTLDQSELYADEIGANNEAADGLDRDEGGVQLQELGIQIDGKESEDHEDHQPSDARTITVNYEGNELWLFKEHDIDDSGDWLLDDSSLVRSSLSDLFQACRASLGEDISHETELGFRFDHFHNMELHEDNTACVAVSLERLIDLYHTLHAQDGVHDPESFYMSLLSRPRFATLLSDVARLADQESGYSGLNAAIAAGETHFADASSGYSTEHEGADPDHEDDVDDQHDSAESAIDEGSAIGRAGHEFKDNIEDDDESQTAEETRTEDVDEPSFETSAHLVPRTHDNDAAQTDAGNENLIQQGEVSNEATQQSPAPLSHVLGEEHDDDGVDYSDAEDPENEEEEEIAVANGSSPSSSTAQGDESATGEIFTRNVEPSMPDKERDLDLDGGSNEAGHENVDHLFVDEQLGYEETVASYGDYAQAYEDEDSIQGFGLGATDNFSTEPGLIDHTNPEYSGTEYPHMSQQNQNDFFPADFLDNNAPGGSTEIADDFTSGGDFLDLDGPPEWAANQKPISQLPEDVIVVHDNVVEHEEEVEVGVLDQTAVAASSAADPIAASSTGLHKSSPQGQKRSIDEVGNMVGDALDLSDTKRPRM